MATVKSAPGAPGIRPSWTSSAKDMVTTALGSSRVWVTLGYGILNEVYWPATGQPQIRDLGFIVVGPSGWCEVKRVNNYRISSPEPYIPLPHIVHKATRTVSYWRWFQTPGATWCWSRSASSGKG